MQKTKKMSNTDPNKIRGWMTGKQQVFDNKLSNFTYKYSQIKKELDSY